MQCVYHYCQRSETMVPVFVGSAQARDDLIAELQSLEFEALVTDEVVEDEKPKKKAK